MNVYSACFVAALFALMGAVMVVNNGWEMALILIGAMAAPFIVFGLIPYILGSRPSGCGGNSKGIFYGYEYKFGAKRPKP